MSEVVGKTFESQMHENLRNENHISLALRYSVHIQIQRSQEHTLINLIFCLH